MRNLPLEKPELRALGQALGEARILDILRRFYAKMSTDLLIGFFFDGRDLDSIAEMQARFLYRAMGLRPSYAGKSPADAHAALPPILSGHFDRRLVLLEEVLRAEGLDDAQRRVWLAFENAFRDAVVSA